MLTCIWFYKRKFSGKITEILLTCSTNNRMIDPNVLDQLTKSISDNIPDGLKLLQHDLEKNIKATLQGLFRDMDLVSRDEFDLQAALLARTLEKLKDLEARLVDLEKN